ncbi:MAG TPA: hypothetical protein VHL79_00320 [Ramlibacter sp.]|jgi:hypothetical protein|nr:hypothetical protein [Ramlibacter sp.]
MYRRFTPASLLKILAALLVLALLAALLLPWDRLRAGWMLGFVVAAPLLVAGAVLLRGMAHRSDVDLYPSELTTLTFPPERRR